MRRVSFSPSLPPHYLTQNNALSFLDIKDQDSPKGEQASAPATMRPGKTIKKVFWMTNLISFTGENHAMLFVLPKWVASLPKNILCSLNPFPVDCGDAPNDRCALKKFSSCDLEEDGALGRGGL